MVALDMILCPVGVFMQMVLLLSSILGLEKGTGMTRSGPTRSQVEFHFLAPKKWINLVISAEGYSNSNIASLVVYLLYL
jgi:hypothetical protein